MQAFLIGVFIVLCSSSLVFANGLQCESPETLAKPTDSGVTVVPGIDGNAHPLYWIKLSAKVQPSQGTLFYLAGGPSSHMTYTDMAESFQRLAYPQFDVILYDYYGFNCSSAIQDRAGLRANFKSFTVPAMATDFINLKRRLVGISKVFLMGGSHGAMLGAQIVSAYPREIEKAILFSGDTESGWLEDGWFRFDELLNRMNASHPGFASNLSQLLSLSEAGKLKVMLGGQEVVVNRNSLEVALWLSFSLDSVAQAALPEMIQEALKGNLDWVSAIYSAERSLLIPFPDEISPTDVSVVTNFHRCNVWFPKSKRTLPAGRQNHGHFLNYQTFVGYWNSLCKEYDDLGGFVFNAIPGAPVAVPVLSWMGDQDTFNPADAQKRWSKLSSSLSFKIMNGWSHDFGADPPSGFLEATKMIQEFLK